MKHQYLENARSNDVSPYRKFLQFFGSKGKFMKTPDRNALSLFFEKNESWYGNNPAGSNSRNIIPLNLQDVFEDEWTQLTSLSDSLNDYRSNCDSMANMRMTTTVNSLSYEKDAIVLSTFLDFSDGVKLLCENFDGRIHSNAPYLIALNDFLSRDGKLNVIVKDSIDPKSKLFRVLKHYFTPEADSQVTVMQFSEEGDSLLKEHSVNSSSDFNFAIADDRFWRVESIYDDGTDVIQDIKKGAKPKHSSTCSFNYPEGVRILDVLFDEISKVSKEINLTTFEVDSTKNK